MSWAFLALYTGDYLRDTRHLTPLRHGVYLLLLMHSWDQQGPLPLDEQECAGIANCRSADEIEALRYVLSKFFIRMDDGWYNERMQKEIDKAKAISDHRSAAGIKGNQAKAKQLRRKSVAPATTPPPPLPLPSPPTSSTPPERAKATPPAVALPDWLPVDNWNSYKEMRAKIRAPLTAQGEALALKTLSKLRDQGHNPSQVIDQAVEKSWRGLFPVKQVAGSAADEWLSRK